jgi:flagellar biosynthesis protein FliQ
MSLEEATMSTKIAIIVAAVVATLLVGLLIYIAFWRVSLFGQFASTFVE